MTTFLSNINFGQSDVNIERKNYKQLFYFQQKGKKEHSYKADRQGLLLRKLVYWKKIDN